MANVKISGLPTASTPLTGAELVPVVQSGVTSQTTVGGLLGGPNGSNLAGFLQSGTGAVATTVQTKLREIVSILDFGADATGVTLCNSALDAAKLVSSTVYFPKGTYRIEGYNLQDLRLVGDGTTGANYGVWNTIIEGSGDIFIDANNFSLENLTIRNTASGTAGKLIQVKNIDTAIGPITNCNFLKAQYHIYHNDTSHTIVGAAITGCLFREATAYSRYYNNAGLFQYLESDCYTQANNAGLYIRSTSTALISASTFELHDNAAIYITNIVTATDVIRSLKFQNLHFEQNGAASPNPDIDIDVSPSKAKITFDNCSLYNFEIPHTVTTNSPSSPVTITWTSNVLTNGDTVNFTSTGTLPTGITAGTTYYVVNRTSNDFQIATSFGGTAINTTTSGSGTITANWTKRGYVNCHNSPSLVISEISCKGFNYDNFASTSYVTKINPAITGDANGISITNAGIQTTQQITALKGINALNGISCTIYNTATATPIPQPSSSQAMLVLVCDSTSAGAATLMLTNSTVTTISSTIGSVTFSYSGGFLAGQTTGGSSFRIMFFNYIVT